MLSRLKRRLGKAYYELLKIDVLRSNYCKLRWKLRRRRLKLFERNTEGVSEGTLSHNLGAFGHDAAFGMGNRMALLLYPTAALLRGVADARVLIVGPRTEDDIFWAWSLGLRGTRGLDIFSYSPWIDLGDIHAAPYESGSFDAVLFAWMLAYSARPEQAIREAKRILKPGGLLGVGMESIAAGKFEEVKASRPNQVNTSSDLAVLINEQVVHFDDRKSPSNYELAVIFRISGSGMNAAARGSR